MLEKMGKTDLGETAKAFMVIFVIGLMMTVMGGLLVSMTAGDTTDFKDETTEDDDTTVDSKELIKELHQQGKGYVALIAFWLPIIGILMIAVGISVLILDGIPVRLVAASVGITIPLILLEGTIPLVAISLVYGIAFSLDVYSTVTSKRFPKYEGNFIIGMLHKKMSITKVWIVYGVSYGAVFITGYTLFDNLYIMVSILAATHLIACITNMYTEKKIKILQH